VARHLQLSPETFEALPWHRRRAIVEGLVWEFTDESNGSTADGPGDDLGELGALGLTVRQI
jgi:hypothetical protein